MKRFLLGLLVGLAGCGQDAARHESTLMHTDFESLQGWLPAPQSELLSREQAHSGSYSIKVDPQHEYSLTYRTMLETLHNTRISRVKVSAWVFVPDAQAQAQLVVSLTAGQDDASKNLLREAIDLQRAVNGQYGRWVNVTKELTLPPDTNSASQLSIYLWRTGGDTPVFLDDLTLENKTPAG